MLFQESQPVCLIKQLVSASSWVNHVAANQSAQSQKVHQSVILYEAESCTKKNSIWKEAVRYLLITRTERTRAKVQRGTTLDKGTRPGSYLNRHSRWCQFLQFCVESLLEPWQHRHPTTQVHRSGTAQKGQVKKCGHLSVENGVKSPEQSFIHAASRRQPSVSGDAVSWLKWTGLSLGGWQSVLWSTVASVLHKSVNMRTTLTRIFTPVRVINQTTLDVLESSSPRQQLTHLYMCLRLSMGQDWMAWKISLWRVG